MLPSAIHKRAILPDASSRVKPRSAMPPQKRASNRKSLYSCFLRFGIKVGVPIREHFSQIGPLPIVAGKSYSAQFMEAIAIRGMTSFIHTHSGPEAWYTFAGETCLATSEGVQIGRAGGPPVIVHGGLPMHLTATGTERRRALVLIPHDSAKPPASIVHDWTPKGLRKK